MSEEFALQQESLITAVPRARTAERAIPMASFSVRFGTGVAGASGAELQPIARPATNSVNIMAIVPVLMGHILHI